MFEQKDLYENLDLAAATQKFYSDVGLTTDNGRISQFASAVGIFHQNLDTLSVTEAKDKSHDDQEKTYITLGRLEDMFLNTFVSGVIKEENKTKVFTADRRNNYNIQFDSRNGLLRWEELLFRIQTAPLLPNDDLPSFILPKNWEGSYNSLLEQELRSPPLSSNPLFGAINPEDREDLSNAPPQ